MLMIPAGMKKHGTIRRAFTLVEILVVVTILGILAAVIVPRFSGVTDEARSSATEGAVGGVRASIASYRTRAVISGSDPYPVLKELVTSGMVIQGEMPINPFNQRSNVQSVSAEQAKARSVVSPDTVGWNYFVDNNANPPTAVFYANSSDATTIPDGAGGTKTANQL